MIYDLRFKIYDKPKKVAIVHDDLVQWGGLERMLLGISEIYPEAPIFTSVIDWENPLIRESFKSKKIRTSFLQKVPGWKALYKPLFALYPFVFEQFDLSEYDLVISITTRFAKSVITKPGQIHICYCYTPPRFLWNFQSDHIPLLARPVLSFLRVLDRVSSTRVDHWIAGSKVAADRIQKIYHQSSVVVPGFVEVSDYSKWKAWDGNYFLVIARLNEYKRVDLAIKAFNKFVKIHKVRNWRMRIIGTGPQMKELCQMACPKIDFLGAVTEEVRMDILSGCSALILPGEEDFGLTSLEAQAMGKPVIAFGKGGVLETVINKKTGLFFDQANEQSLLEALVLFCRSKFNGQEIKENAAKFSKTRFKVNFSSAVASLQDQQVDI